VQGWSLLLVGPFVDRLVTGRWVSTFEVSVPALACLGFSCAIAVLVNVSQFMCLGRFSAVTFQVTGHAKTVMVLLGSWLYLSERMGRKEVTGGRHRRVAQHMHICVFAGHCRHAHRACKVH
jgi:solute carrier family 35, member E3